jgi:PncC family amidohydrolase
MPDEGSFPADLSEAAWRLAEVLQRHETRLVFAESCTAGLASATLAIVPGISKWLCGSAVTYQEATKISWVGVDPAELENFTAVSHQVARAMAVGVLKSTPHADLAVSVTGHLGPYAPPELDGVIFVGTAVRARGSNKLGKSKSQLGQHLTSDIGQCSTNDIDSGAPVRIVLRTSERQQRQVEATIAVLDSALMLARNWK